MAVSSRTIMTPYLQISTVDAVQGAEKSVIILSCVRTSRIGFADCPKRVNVAITRARHHLIVLGRLPLTPLRCFDAGQVYSVNAGVTPFCDQVVLLEILCISGRTTFHLLTVNTCPNSISNLITERSYSRWG